MVTSLPQKYPARAHAQKVSKLLGQEFQQASILLTGTLLELYPNSDMTAPFRQDRYFNYLTGAFDLHNAAVTYDISADKLTLWLPPIDEDDVMWSGLPLSLEQAAEKYDVDEVKYISEELQKTLASKGNVITVDEPKHSQEFLKIAKNEPKLREALDEARSTKDAYEITLLRKAAEITDNSHTAVMSALPIETNEGHIHAEFVYHAMRQGSKFQAYDPICCSGTDCGTLHYVRNDQPLDGKQLVLIDAGAEWQSYASDVTRTFPISGEWTKESREIYETVQDMHKQTMEGCAPGVSWDSLHELGHKILIERFLKLGIFHNGTAEEIFKSRVSVAFFPHGLGHMLGMDTHDVAGRPNYSDPDVMFRYLRLRRELKEGYYVTVEPGCYFNNFLLESYFKNPDQNKYINKEVLDKYMAVGGVRIEDDVLITATGYENLTKITSDPDEVAAIVKKGIEKGRSFFHNVV